MLRLQPGPTARHKGVLMQGLGFKVPCTFNTLHHNGTFNTLQHNGTPPSVINNWAAMSVMY